MIELDSLSVRYKTKEKEFLALDGINLKLGKGDICAIIGPSGCGKSTLVHVLSGIISGYGGSALIGGKPANPKLHRIGFVPQSYGLLEWADVYSNSVLGLSLKGYRLSEEKSYIEHILGKLGLNGLNSKYPGCLSGGQKQRVSIARAFILKPDVLLMDEPFSALDAITREETQDLFLEIWKEYKVTTVFVTHSIEEAVLVGSKIAIMSPSPGRIQRFFDNPFFGMESLRLSDDYYRFSLEIRKMVRDIWTSYQ